MSILREVEFGYARGWSYTPLNGKRPYIDGWQNKPRPSYQTVRDWASKGNVGVRTGLVSGIVVIDMDGPAVVNAGEFPKTPIVVTGSGGYHLYYKADRQINNSVGKVGPCIHCLNTEHQRQCPAQDNKRCCSHIDVRGDGGQVVAPGSIHPDTNQPYTWKPGFTPSDIPFAPYPHNHKWIIEPEKPLGKPDCVLTRPKSNRYAQKVLDTAYERVSTAAEGTRNDTLYRTAFDLGGSIYAGILDYQATRSVLISAGDACGLPRYETEKTVERGLREGEANPKDMDRAVVTAQPDAGEFQGF